MIRREPNLTGADRAAWHRARLAAAFSAGVTLGFVIMAAVGAING